MAIWSGIVICEVVYGMAYGSKDNIYGNNIHPVSFSSLKAYSSDEFFADMVGIWEICC